VGTLGIEIMNSMAFSLLANSNPEVDQNQEVELTFGSLNFYIGPSATTRLSDLTKSVPSAGKAERMTTSGSSIGSSSEANSPVSLAATENLQEKLEEPDEIGQETMVEEAEDKSRDIASRSSGVSKSIHQLCVIITEAAEEENNHTGSKEVNMQVDKLRSNGKKEKEKVHVSAGEWRMIMTAVNRGTDVTTN
jgi:DNA polymerase/3'-5' exonuclease PolX